MSAPLNKLTNEELSRGLREMSRGRWPVVCWDGDDTWLVVRPERDPSFMVLQRRRGMRVGYLIAPDAEEILRQRSLVSLEDR